MVLRDYYMNNVRNAVINAVLVKGNRINVDKDEKVHCVAQDNIVVSLSHEGIGRFPDRRKTNSTEVDNNFDANVGDYAFYRKIVF